MNNKKNKANNKNNCCLGNNKKSLVDCKRLNELYLGYKIKNIKINKLKKEQDIKKRISFIPKTNSNRIKNNKINYYIS